MARILQVAKIRRPMNKRYFIFCLLAISLALCACSSEDQPEGGNKFTYSIPEPGSGGSSEPAEDLIVAGTEGGACLEGGACNNKGLECDAATGKCQKITPPSPGPTTCPDGQTLDVETQACVAIKVEPKTCPDGQILDAEAQKCVAIKIEPKTCPEGQTLVADTQECVAIIMEGSGAWGEKCKNEGACSDAGLKCDEDICVINMKTPALFVATGGGGVFTSLDGGQNWIARNVGMEKDPDKYIKALYYDGYVLFAGTNGDGIFKLGDGSQKWGKATDTGLDNKNILSMCKFKGSSYAGTNGGGVFKLSKGVWETKNTGLGGYHVVNNLLCTDSAMYAVTSGGAYTSTDGDKWLPLSAASATTNKMIISLAKFGTDIYAGVSNGGVFKFSGGKWVKEPGADISNKTITALGRTGMATYAGSNNGEVFSLGAAGGVWTKSITLTGVYDGPGDPDTPPPLKSSTLIDYNGKIYIGTNGYGIYDLSNKQMNLGLTSKNINAMVHVNVP